MITPADPELMAAYHTDVLVNHGAHTVAAVLTDQLDLPREDALHLAIHILVALGLVQFSACSEHVPPNPDVWATLLVDDARARRGDMKRRCSVCQAYAWPLPARTSDD